MRSFVCLLVIFAFGLSFLFAFGACATLIGLAIPLCCNTWLFFNPIHGRRNRAAFSDQGTPATRLARQASDPRSIVFGITVSDTDAARQQVVHGEPVTDIV